MASAKVVAKKNGNILNVDVSGYIGENAELFDLNYTGATKIVMDLGGVNYINSVGVKNWILWTGRFPKEMIVEVHRCPTLIVNQVNTVVGFLRGDSTVQSLTAPFVCNKCSREEGVLLERGVHYQYAKEASPYFFKSPEKMCPKCNIPMELDAIENKFFNFLRSVRK